MKQQADGESACGFWGLDGDDDFADLLVGLHMAIGFDDLG
jgi:hypothetical protein